MNFLFPNYLAYLLPRVFYGEQIQLGMQGPLLADDNNDTANQVTIKLMGGSRAIDVSFSLIESYQIFHHFDFNSSRFHLTDDWIRMESNDCWS